MDRFGKNSEVNEYEVIISDGIKTGKSRDKSSRFLNSLHCLQSAKAWYEFLQSEMVEGFTINHLYEQYNRFYNNEHYTQFIRQDIIGTLKDSVHRIENKLVDPVSYPSYKKESSGVKIKKYSLRGDSRFAQLAVCEIKDKNDLRFIDQYAYPEDITNESFTFQVESIQGFGKSEQNLLDFMAKKHHTIKDVKKAFKDKQILDAARNPETPIYLSYTPEDLEKVNAKSHPYAVYYAIGAQQPIGAISLNQLNENGEDDGN